MCHVSAVGLCWRRIPVYASGPLYVDKAPDTSIIFTDTEIVALKNKFFVHEGYGNWREVNLTVVVCPMITDETCRTKTGRHAWKLSHQFFWYGFANSRRHLKQNIAWISCAIIKKSFHVYNSTFPYFAPISTSFWATIWNPSPLHMLNGLKSSAHISTVFLFRFSWEQ